MPIRREGANIKVVIPDELTDAIAGIVQSIVGKMGIATKEDVERVDKRIASLRRKLNRAVKQSGAGKTTKKKASKKSESKKP